MECTASFYSRQFVAAVAMSVWGLVYAATISVPAHEGVAHAQTAPMRTLPVAKDQRTWWSWQRAGEPLAHEAAVQVGDQLMTPYGIYTVHHPVIAQLCNHHVMKRIHDVRQYGVCHFMDGCATSYTRWKHCMGVMVLLHRFGASLEEEVAGMVHDASHTVFSHAGDFFFKNQSTSSSYQDQIHSWYLDQLGTNEILTTYGLSIEKIDHDNANLRMLDQDLPDVAADRLEYNIRAGLDEHLLYPDEIEPLLQSLRFADGVWFFTDSYWAARLGRVSLLCTQKLWGSPENALANELLCEALRRAIQVGFADMHTIHHGTDDCVWALLQSMDDPVVRRCLQAIHEVKKLFVIAPVGQADRVIVSKFRGINPLVRNAAGQLVRLTECDAAYAREFQAVKERMRAGWPIWYTPRGRALFGELPADVAVSVVS